MGLDGIRMGLRYRAPNATNKHSQTEYWLLTLCYAKPFVSDRHRCWSNYREQDLNKNIKLVCHSVFVARRSLEIFIQMIFLSQNWDSDLAAKRDQFLAKQLKWKVTIAKAIYSDI